MCYTRVCAVLDAAREGAGSSEGVHGIVLNCIVEKQIMKGRIRWKEGAARRWDSTVQEMYVCIGCME